MQGLIRAHAARPCRDRGTWLLHLPPAPDAAADLERYILRSTTLATQALRTATLVRRCWCMPTLRKVPPLAGPITYEKNWCGERDLRQLRRRRCRRLPRVDWRNRLTR